MRLVSLEAGLVHERGAHTTTQRVAMLINRNAMPTGEILPRETALPAWKITGAVAHHDMRVSTSLNRLAATMWQYVSINS